MRQFQYPYGAMRNYPRKFVPFQHRKLGHRNKYFAKGITIDGHHFDSKVEGGWYLHLKHVGATFRIHPTFQLKPFHITKNGIHIRKRKYTPDFAIYKNYEDFKNHKPFRVDDVKGYLKIQPQDSMKFGAFEDKFDIPVYIVRWNKTHGWSCKTRCF